ncbi:hypothetical protein AYI68_g7177 [Smittium mucronatum]|uniref:Uncharacterized protein n=1 Tax=Smittium mucronatum TaxID=133383 RepID=A0A1R0GPE6_9FUNG|nr:hypothetical protein AYI68_g7177 [Smittium mucronatum]
MNEATCSQELSSFSTNNSSLKLLNSYSWPTSNRINKNAEIRLNVKRWTCAREYVSAMLKDWFLLFRDGPPLESLFSKSLCVVSTTPNHE